jgi:hypothetical protein
MPGSGFRRRVVPSVPDAECQDPDFGGDSDLSYLVPDAECQDPDFGGESDLLNWLEAGGKDPDPGGESDLM